MRKQYTSSDRSLRFRRWSRKGYAAFLSRLHCVTIGTLAAPVSERLYAKQVSLSPVAVAAMAAYAEDLPDDLPEEEADSVKLTLSHLNLINFFFIFASDICADEDLNFKLLIFDGTPSVTEVVPFFYV